MTKASDTAIEYLDQILEMYEVNSKCEPFTDIPLCELHIDAVKYAIAAINTVEEIREVVDKGDTEK